MVAVAGRLARLLPRPDQPTLWASSIPLRAERRRATRRRLNPLRNSDDGDGKSGGNWIGGRDRGRDSQETGQSPSRYSGVWLLDCPSSADNDAHMFYIRDTTLEISSVDRYIFSCQR